MKIEAVTVCDNYADFLSWTLPINRSLFDKYVVVTSEEDEQTRAICEYYHVLCIRTNAFYTDGEGKPDYSLFNKANGINRGLAALALDGWVVHLDADIYLPPRSREALQAAHLDSRCLYGMDRMMCTDFKAWLRYLSKPENQHGRDGCLRANAFPLGARLLDLGRDGYVPIGFFQMWNPRGSGVFQYPNEHGYCDRTDTLFARGWRRIHRRLLPELVGIHLESAAVEMGANWRGRTTPVFGATCFNG
jgi:hypothetical protein